MRPAFEARDDAVRMSLRREEALLLRNVRDELVALLEGGDVDHPIEQRLFPQAVQDDEDADAELRGLVHDDLRTNRLAALVDVLGYLDRGQQRRGRLVVDLVEEEPAVVLGVLNDLRLAIAADVGIELVEHRERVTEADVQRRLGVLDYFAMWQEQLLAVLDPVSATHYEEGHRPEEEH